jgi:low affinity Fe/Cu permease
MRGRGISHRFARFASGLSTLSGHHWTFVLMFLLIIAWAVSGPFFAFSDTWQLVANTVTTLITFLMVFIIQNTQNRDARAMHLKLDELLRAIPEARNQFMDVEEEDLDEIAREKELVDSDAARSPPG